MKTVTSSECRLNKSPSQERVQRKTASNVTQATKRKNMSAEIRDKSLIQIINVRLANQGHCLSQLAGKQRSKYDLNSII